MARLKKVSIDKTKIFDAKTNLLFMGMFNKGNLSKDAKVIDGNLNGFLSNAISIENFSGTINKKISLYGNSKIKRISIQGLGDKAKLTSDIIWKRLSNAGYQFDDKLTDLIILINDNKRDCEKMSSHIDFIDSVYQKLKTPIDYICKRLE